MSGYHSCWDVLEIAATKDARTIKKAYAKKVKQYHPEDDPEGFQQVRAAYEQALGYAKSEIDATGMVQYEDEAAGKSDVEDKESNEAYYETFTSLAAHIIRHLHEETADGLMSYITSLQWQRAYQHSLFLHIFLEQLQAYQGIVTQNNFLLLKQEWAVSSHVQIVQKIIALLEEKTKQEPEINGNMEYFINQIMEYISLHQIEELTSLLCNTAISSIRNHPAFIAQLMKRLNQYPNTVSYDVIQLFTLLYAQDLDHPNIAALLDSMKKGRLDFEQLQSSANADIQFFLERWQMLCEMDYEDTREWIQLLTERNWQEVLIDKNDDIDGFMEKGIQIEYTKDYSISHVVSNKMIQAFDLKRLSQQSLQAARLHQILIKTTVGSGVNEGNIWKRRIYDQVHKMMSASARSNQKEALKILFQDEEFIQYKNDVEFLYRIKNPMRACHYRASSKRLINSFFELDQKHDTLHKELKEALEFTPEDVKKQFRKKYIMFAAAIIPVLGSIYIISIKDNRNNSNKNMQESIEHIQKVSEDQNKKDLARPTVQHEDDEAILVAVKQTQIEFQEEGGAVITTLSGKIFHADGVAYGIVGRLAIIVRNEQYYALNLLNDKEYGPYDDIRVFYEPNTELAHYYVVVKGANMAAVFTDEMEQITGYSTLYDYSAHSYYIIYDEEEQDFRFTKKESGLKDFLNYEVVKNGKDSNEDDE